MAITHPRAKLKMSETVFTDSFIITLVSGTANDLTTLENSHSYHAIMLQISPTTTSTFTFTSSMDGVDFTPLRAWDISVEIHTTSVSVVGGTTAAFTIYCEGMKQIRIDKVGSTAVTYDAVYHKSPSSHAMWTLH